MRCPTLAELPPPLPGKTGWPWTEETPPLPEAMTRGSSWPRISIVTASYNRDKYIEETIRSILLQGYPDLEYIIIDGASSDRTVEIIRKYEPWLASWVSEKDRGQSHALNKGFAKCTGEVITFFSSDDIYLKGTLKDVGSHWPKLQDYGAIVGGFFFMDVHAQQITKMIPPQIPHEGPIDIALVPPGKYRLHQEATFYSRHALDDVGRYVREDLHFNADRELLYRICRKHKIFLAQRAYSAFRWHEGSGAAASTSRYPALLEFAKLRLSFCSKGDKDYRRKKRIANYFLAKAYLASAKYSRNILNSMIALFKALFIRPDLLLQKKYVAIWLNVLHIMPMAKRLRPNHRALSDFGD